MDVEDLLELLGEFDKWHPRHDRKYPAQLRFNPDGSGSLSVGLCNTVMEFADFDEVATYMERRIPKLMPAQPDAVIVTEEREPAAAVTAWSDPEVWRDPDDWGK